MTNPCPVTLRGEDVCGASVAVGRIVCRGCEANLRLDLREITDPERDLLAELDLAIARQTAMPPATGAGGCPDGCMHGDDEPGCVAGVRLQLDERAAQASLALVTLLHGWARVFDEEHPVRLEHYRDDDEGRAALRHVQALRDGLLATAYGQAQLLAAPDVRTAEWAPDLAGELRAAVRAAWAACDRPPEARVIGRCRTPECARPVYAREGDLRARCTGCRAAWDVAELREASLAAAEDAELPAHALASVLGVPTGTVRSWIGRERLKSTRTNDAGQPLYRVSDGHAAKQREDTSA